MRYTGPLSAVAAATVGSQPVVVVYLTRITELHIGWINFVGLSVRFLRFGFIHASIRSFGDDYNILAAKPIEKMKNWKVFART